MQKGRVIAASGENIGDPDSFIANDVEDHSLPLEGDNTDAKPEIISRYAAKGGIPNFFTALEDTVSEPGGYYRIEACFQDIAEQLLDIFNSIGAILHWKALHSCQLLCFA